MRVENTELDVSAGLRLVQVEVSEVVLVVAGAVLVQTGQAGVVAVTLHTGGAHWHRPDLVLVVTPVVVLELRVEQVGLKIFQLIKIFPWRMKYLPVPGGG